MRSAEHRSTTMKNFANSDIEIRTVAGLGTTQIMEQHIYLLLWNFVESFKVTDHWYKIKLPSLLEAWEYYRMSIFIFSFHLEWAFFKLPPFFSDSVITGSRAQRDASTHSSSRVFVPHRATLPLFAVSLFFQIAHSNQIMCLFLLRALQTFYQSIEYASF